MQSLYSLLCYVHKTYICVRVGSNRIHICLENFQNKALYNMCNCVYVCIHEINNFT